MARTFPVSLDEFFGDLAKTAATMDLAEARASADTVGGDTFPIDNGPRLWGGSVQIKHFRDTDEGKVMGLVDVLRQGNATFYVSRPTANAPREDRNGLRLGGATVTISAVPNAREVTLTGLPEGYVISTGDEISWPWSSGTRYALHRVGGTVVADSSGNATVEVAPYVRGDPVGAEVELIEPKCLAMMVPGSFSPPTAGPERYSGYSFNWIQVKP